MNSNGNVSVSEPNEKIIQNKNNDIFQGGKDYATGYIKEMLLKAQKGRICSRSIQRREYGDGEGDHPGS